MPGSDWLSFVMSKDERLHHKGFIDDACRNIFVRLTEENAVIVISFTGLFYYTLFQKDRNIYKEIVEVSNVGK